MSKAESFNSTIHIRDHCLCLHAQRAARALSRRFDEAFRPLGNTSGQFSRMNGLNRPDPATIGALASLLAMDRTTVTANLKPLERAGLVETADGMEDRRTRGVRLTEAGAAVLAAAKPIWIAEHGALEAQLDGQSDALRSGMRVIA